MAKYQFTARETENLSDVQILRLLVKERLNNCSKPESHLYDRLKKISRTLDTMATAYNAPDKGVGEVRSFACEDLVDNIKKEVELSDMDDLGRITEFFYGVVIVGTESENDRLQLQVADEDYNWNTVFGDGVTIPSHEPSNKD